MAFIMLNQVKHPTNGWGACGALAGCAPFAGQILRCAQDDKMGLLKIVSALRQRSNECVVIQKMEMTHEKDT